MSIYGIPPALEEKVGRPAAQAILDVVHETVRQAIDEEKKDMLSRVDEKVTARYADIHRRVHEDITGVELRLSARMGALETGLRKEMTDLAIRMSDLEVRMIRWMVSLMVVQGGLMIAIGWASKRLF